jgi:hypothetical protein
MPTQIKRLQVVFAKLEATEGTDPVPTATDALQLVAPASITWGAYQNNEQDDLDNQKLESAAPLAPTYPWGEITCRLYQRGKGATYSTTAGPEPHAILQGALMSATFAAAQWTYDTISVLAAGQPSLTFYAFKGLDTNVWVLHKLLAAKVSKLVYGGEAGKPGFIDVVARGQYVEPTDAALISPTYMTSIPPAYAAAASWQIGALATAFVKRSSVTLENILQFRDNANSINTRHLITGRRLTWDVAVEAARVADYNPWLKWTSRAQEALVQTLGVGAGSNKIVFTGDRAQITPEPTVYEDENGLVRFTAKGVLDPGGTNRFNLLYAS